MVMSATFRSDANYLDDSTEQITEHLADTDNLLLTPNHQDNCYTPTLTGIVAKSTFAPIRTNTIIPAKSNIVTLNIDHIDTGGRSALFAEGHRNKGDIRKVQEFHRGVSQIAHGVK